MFIHLHRYVVQPSNHNTAIYFPVSVRLRLFPFDLFPSPRSISWKSNLCWFYCGFTYLFFCVPPPSFFYPISPGCIANCLLLWQRVRVVVCLYRKYGEFFGIFTLIFNDCVSFRFIFGCVLETSIHEMAKTTSTIFYLFSCARFFLFTVRQIYVFFPLYITKMVFFLFCTEQIPNRTFGDSKKLRGINAVDRNRLYKLNNNVHQIKFFHCSHNVTRRKFL